jgi:hypothetical protein
MHLEPETNGPERGGHKVIERVRRCRTDTLDALLVIIPVPILTVLTVILLSCLPASAHGQTKPILIQGLPSCPVCTIERYQLSTITDASLPGGAIVEGGEVHVNSDLTFLLITGPRWDEVYVADRSGNLVRRVGRTGRGPGEYIGPTYVVEVPSEYWIVDVVLHRITRLSKVSLEVVGTMTLPPGELIGAPVPFADGSFVLRADIRTRDRIGFALHHGSVQGILRSFAPADTILPGRVAPPLVLAKTRDGSGVWAAHVNQYRIEKWDTAGRLMSIHERNADWFSVRTDGRRPPGQRYAAILGIHEDSSGRLWVHAAIRTTAADGIRFDPSRSESVVEILEPAEGRVLATERFPDVAAASTMGGFFQMVPRSTLGGSLEIEIWGFRLNEKQVRPARLVLPSSRTEPFGGKAASATITRRP